VESKEPLLTVEPEVADLAQYSLQRPSIVPVHNIADVAPQTPTETLKSFQVETPVLTEQETVDGVFLRHLREKAGASLHDLVAITKINRRYLEALEANQLDRLPAKVYVQGFVKSIARALNIEAETITQHYMDFYREKFKSGL
jgi:hypothetical protein